MSARETTTLGDVGRRLTRSGSSVALLTDVATAAGPAPGDRDDAAASALAPAAGAGTATALEGPGAVAAAGRGPSAAGERPPDHPRPQR